MPQALKGFGRAKSRAGARSEPDFVAEALADIPHPSTTVPSIKAIFDRRICFHTTTRYRNGFESLGYFIKDVGFTCLYELEWYHMILSDNEKRDVIKYLEAGKPLPEKYRFLLFDNAREVELLWNGKNNEVTNTVLPFQVIEQIDEPRNDEKIGLQSTLFDDSGRQITGWTNKLIWGDNKLILSSLANGPMRKEIEAQGGLKLIYIDPPFDVGADFSMELKIGDGKDEDSFLSLIHI